MQNLLPSKVINKKLNISDIEKYYISGEMTRILMS